MKFTGETSEVQRIMTGFYSLDQAFVNQAGDLGVPIGVGYEIFGTNHIGKSSFSYSLAGILAREQKGDILLCDFEGFDPIFLGHLLDMTQFTGELRVVVNKDDEKQLTETVDLLGDSKKEYRVAVLDSVGAISPMSEREGDIGDANMGRRALLLAQFVRKSLHVFRFNVGKTVIMINHWYPRIGIRGYDTPGGEVKKYLASVRILLRRDEEFPDNSYVLEGDVVKNRWGFPNAKFYAFMVAGMGMHRGLSCLWDCIKTKRVEKDGKSSVIRIGDVSYGRFSAFVKAAKEGHDEIFEPFIEILKEVHDDRDSSPEQDTTENETSHD